MKFDGFSRVWHRKDGVEELVTSFTFLNKINILAVISVFYLQKKQQIVLHRQRMEFSLFGDNGDTLEAKIEMEEEGQKIKLKGWGFSEIFYLLKEK
jgi:hypothetical protein